MTDELGVRLEKLIATLEEILEEQRQSDEQKKEEGAVPHNVLVERVRAYARANKSLTELGYIKEQKMRFGRNFLIFDADVTGVPLQQKGDEVTVCLAGDEILEVVVTPDGYGLTLAPQDLGQLSDAALLVYVKTLHQSFKEVLGEAGQTTEEPGTQVRQAMAQILDDLMALSTNTSH